MNIKSRQMKNAIFLITFAVVLMWVLDNISFFLDQIAKFIGILSPFILGFAIAFIFNGPMNFIENRLFKSGKIKNSTKRTISYLLTLILFCFVVILVLFIIIPEIINTFQDLSVQIPSYWKKIQNFVLTNLESNSQVREWINNQNIDWNSVEKNIIQFFKNSALDWAGSTFNFASSLVNKVVKFILAFIFSIYLLLQKEKLVIQVKKIILALFSEKAANRIFNIGRLSNNVFLNFLAGQLTEALIIGALFFVTMSIFKFPYALMISVVIAITALIPIAGAFIGCAVGVFLILVVDAKMAFWFIIMFLVIQQIEGNLIYPYVVGKASGLPSIWIFVAVTLGGSLFGILGIILFIPIVSILYAIFAEIINNRLKEKNIKNINS